MNREGAGDRQGELNNVSFFVSDQTKSSVLPAEAATDPQPGLSGRGTETNSNVNVWPHHAHRPEGRPRDFGLAVVVKPIAKAPGERDAESARTCART